MVESDSPNGESETTRVRSLVYSKSSVLIVEDDELTRERMELLLTSADFDAMSVGSAAEARMAMDTLVFPIVIIDRMLGDADGLSLIREFRERYQAHRVFLMMLSALDSQEELDRGLAAGADAYLSKKDSDAALLESLAKAREVVRYRVR
jgi:DNA-binding response OmpR family regulator